MNTLSSIEAEFARFAGEMAESFSFNKSLGQIYGLLYISSQPLSLSAIATKLLMSKGNASINLRVLENWGTVRPVSVSGTRQDYYEANRNIRDLVVRRLVEELDMRMSTAEQVFNRLLKEPGTNVPDNSQNQARKKVEELRSLVATVRKKLRKRAFWLRFLP